LSFQLKSPEPKGDQPKAILSLVAGLRNDIRHQVLHGVTGSGKTLTLANIIHHVERPTLILSPVKTLVTQTQEALRSYFVDAAVCRFVSDYDIYRPQGYDLFDDKYSPKRAKLDAEITRCRMSTILALVTGRRDVVVVASVSALFPLGSPEMHRRNLITLAVGETLDIDEFVDRLSAMRYQRQKPGSPLKSSQFRDHGDSVEVFSPAEALPYEIEFQGNVIEKIYTVDAATGGVIREHERVVVPMAYVFILPDERIEPATNAIGRERTQQIKKLRSQGNELAIQRLVARTDYDTRMLEERGWCPSMENYHSALADLPSGTPPFTLFDYFPEDYLLVVDESHKTVSDIKGLAASDRTRKLGLIEHGSALPSALNYRPLTFTEWEERAKQVVFLSATPGEYELSKAGRHIVTQVIRPTFVPDPEVKLVPKRGQMQRIEAEIRQRVDVGERALVMVRTIKQAESVAEHLSSCGFRCKSVHSKQSTKTRGEVLKQLRDGDLDMVVGIGLLREGLDVPAVSLVAILDADGCFRSESSLLQFIGRAARNENGKVLLFCGTVTGWMQRAITATRKRREFQLEYNRAHRIVVRRAGE
jgi:excinuclease ABC subunit B